MAELSRWWALAAVVLAQRLFWRDTLIRRLADRARRLSRATWAHARSQLRYDCAAILDDGAWRRYTRRAVGLGRIRGAHSTSDDFDGSVVSGALDALVADGTARGGGATGRRIRDGWLGRFGPHRLDGSTGFGGFVAAGRLGPGHGAGLAHTAGMDRVALLGCGSGTSLYTGARGCTSWWVFWLAGTGGADVWRGWRANGERTCRGFGWWISSARWIANARWWILGWLDLGRRTWTWTWTRWDGADLRIMREGPTYPYLTFCTPRLPSLPRRCFLVFGSGGGA
ncbi:hypothetical protein GGX14DRAFT_664665 [Mycena pura]|uniref:Uncharacterized protein n=1 Tax=Mycena pura TaxID=153505 RepID=A0AAD6Y373_9AGAR|nr:hypothetical protein GGX14DRAFT_664665 [Mycena pura]